MDICKERAPLHRSLLVQDFLKKHWNIKTVNTITKSNERVCTFVVSSMEEKSVNWIKMVFKWNNICEDTSLISIIKTLDEPKFCKHSYCHVESLMNKIVEKNKRLTLMRNDN